MMLRVHLAFFGIFLVSVLIIPNAFAENVPDWVKNNAGWWAQGQIDDNSFVTGIEWLASNDIIQVPSTTVSETTETIIPSWIKNTAGWWADDKISETEFVNAIAYLVKIGIITIESTKSPESIAEMWKNGHIDDDEFLANVEHMIEKEIITIQSDSITKTSQLPDWLVNNAGWWAARIFTNSDFNFDPEYTKEEIYPCFEFSISESCLEITFNSYGLRGAEFQEQKHDIDFRIFAVGGSTTFGSGDNDDETWSVHLQQIINEKITDKKIEVINGGVGGATTVSEYDLIKNKLSSFEPDLIIMYDGVNDYHRVTIDETIQNWKSVCELGKNEGFDVIIIVQALPSAEYRVLTAQEIKSALQYFSYLQVSQQYVDAFEELDNVCTKTVDFRGIFDYTQEPVFWDHAHTMSFGNKIIAENVFSVISPTYFGQTYSVIHNEPKTGVVYAVGADLSGKNFDNLNLQNAVFDMADLSNTSFKNTNIDGARFVHANLSNSNLLDRIDLSNINLARTDLSNMNLEGKNLTGTVLTGADLTGSILTGANLSATNLTFADLTNANMSQTNLSDAILFRSNLSGQDLRSIIFTNTDFRYAIFSGSILPDSILVNNDFEYAVFNEVDLSGKNLSNSKFQYAAFDNANLENTNLTNSFLVQVDFTKIKNKSLAGANLSEASFAHSNLSGINLAGTIIEETKFWQANLSGQDFTNNVNIYGTNFLEADLTNANFEGTDLFTDEVLITVFKNKAHIIRGVTQTPETESMLRNDLFDDNQQILIFSAEVRGNDIVVEYIVFNSFSHANLENANFKNADLKFGNFYQANLTNADLSGADLRKALLGEADLSNANLEGANLEDATLDNAILSNANLKCINHPICVSG
jgi:uncharacterized protein YjbI with pentapeptide repeats